MQYQTIINLLDNTPNQPSKNWVEINDRSYRAFSTGSQIKFKMSRLCDCSDVYILVKGDMTVTNRGTAAALNNRNKKVICKNCAPFADCISEINKEIDHAKDIDVVMPM